MTSDLTHPKNTKSATRGHSESALVTSAGAGLDFTAPASADAILNQVMPWCGSIAEAEAWFTSQPIAALGNRTAAALVAQGHASDVLAYIEAISVNGYA